MEEGVRESVGVGEVVRVVVVVLVGVLEGVMEEESDTVSVAAALLEAEALGAAEKEALGEALLLALPELEGWEEEEELARLLP